ncbi:protein kinase [Lentzea sp. HUAS12]|uniref:protein kinase domain-containing protein n=1 Tax=Lentzea sp. HUAS12 TaxID=2951806 RepID=UPI00209F0DD5|nr:protein kinase [Lentzea sp. HUAS12]USX55577.1 substrate-binding domain-containing protein [Lentzea sp. HUAS12]
MRDLPKRRVVAGATFVAAVSLVVFLSLQGLDRADKWASVISALVALTSLWFVLPKPGPDAGKLLDALELDPLHTGDPREIGEYTLLGRVGSGATGNVFLGASGRLGQLVVVKVMGAEVAANPVSRERFRREIRSVDEVGRAAGGEFPTLLDSNADAERPWFATEYLPSRSLQELVTGPWRPAAVAWLAAAVARKLRLIHAKGLVHRDLKPANVLLGVEDLWIIDLGIAKNREDAGLTRHGAVGTVAFMSPEQARGTEEVTAASDVFSLGALLVHAATGTPPFGNDPDDTVRRILADEPDLSGLAGWDSALVALLRRCLDKDPARRPSLDEIIEVCTPFAGDAPAEVRARAAELGAAMAVARDQASAPPVPWWRQVRTRWTALAAVVALLAFVVVPFLVPSPEVTALASCSTPPDTTVHIGVSADKSELFKEFADKYGTRSADGHCVKVRITELNSGTAANTLARGWTESDGPRPDVWSPASSEWLDIARDRAAPGSNALAALQAQSRGPVVTSPLVVAMPKPMAETLGWPSTRDVSWRTLADLAADPQGWARYGKDWGPFRLGKTNPNYSTSGLNATIGAFHAFRANIDSTGPLEDGDVDNVNAQRFVQSIEQSIVHYGETSLHFLRNLRTAERQGQGLSYVSALTVDESSMLAYNSGYPAGALSPVDRKEGEPTTKLVAMYPKEGTIFHDHPYVPLAWPDTSTAKREVSEDFFTHLRSGGAQKRFGELGFRDPSRKSNEVSEQNGVSPDFAVKEVQAPSARTLNKVLTAWSTVRKPANVLLVVDTSGSMRSGVTAEKVDKQTCDPKWLERDPVTRHCPSKIELVKKYRTEIVTGFTNSDRLGLWNFSSAGYAGKGPSCRDDHCEQHPIGPLDEVKRREIANKIAELPADGGTGLFDTVDQAVTTMRQQFDQKAINAVVVLSDGKNEKETGLDLAQLVERIKVTAGSEPVRVFTLAYGFSPEDATGREELKKIAEATAAGAYEAADPSTITDDLVAAITSNF